MRWNNPPVAFVSSTRLAVFFASLAPLILLVHKGLGDALGANPIEKITRTTGWWTLFFLAVTLAVTPARKLAGWPWLGRLRRMLGLFAFFYGLLHFLTYFVLDQFFDWMSIGKDIVKRPYITIGFTAFVLLIPLAATSTDGMIRRLGGKGWRRLHKLVYIIAGAGVLHFAWLVKKDITEPLIFGFAVAALLGWRAVDGLRNARRPALDPTAPLVRARGRPSPPGS
ncbi:protein-methionine-sulfoxide reductase heme-binding subunit MsrQ [Methylotetracoccus oryzae]|uniref:sulfite oxidase heme-binding subunit YedZ n=1 Tax=Methylotetracoccus oryzae TaxID=1919059 RepID=UPI001119AF0E|nr:protein-methionine-sulfoxide reductase heme-binding subunit MsrQ [Methylotetracoccus oryzae]